MKRHPALKDFQILARDTLNGSYIILQIGNIKIMCVYNPPSQPEEIDIWLEEIITKCNANTLDDVIILGDFNARCREWGDHSANAKGRLLKRWAESNGLERVDTGPDPTYVHLNRRSCLHKFRWSDWPNLKPCNQRRWSSPNYWPNSTFCKTRSSTNTLRKNQTREPEGSGLS